MLLRAACLRAQAERTKDARHRSSRLLWRERCTDAARLAGVVDDADVNVVRTLLERVAAAPRLELIAHVGHGKKTNGGTQTSATPVVESRIVAPEATPVGAAASATPQAILSRFQEQAALSFIGTCPDCGSSLEFAEGCVKCHACGYSECG